MKFNTLLFTALAACLLPAFAHAESDQSQLPAAAHKKKAKLFKQADANRDKQLSLQELQDVNAERLVKNFATIDRDADGQLSKSELRAARQQRLQNRDGAPRKPHNCDKCTSDS